MHHIQAKILRQLLYTEALNYAAMRPQGVESNHFAYHLEQLLKEKLILKDDKQYYLSAAGLSLIDRLSQETMHARLQPHIVTAIDLTTPDGQTLLFTRNFQPFLHRAGWPLGKMHYSESTAAAAARELQEKTGLTGMPLVHRGMAYIDARQKGTTISRVLYHIFHGDVAKPLPTVTPAHRGSCTWADHTAYAPSQLMPGFLEIKALLATTKQLFFTEITEDLV